MSRTIDQLAETGSSAPDDYLIKRSTATGADQRISVANFTNFPAMPQVNGAPIVESGSNSDGEWTRWADGTQVVRGTIVASSSGDSVSTVGTWNFPISFAATPVVSITQGYPSHTTGSNRRTTTRQQTVSATAVTVDWFAISGQENLGPGDSVDVHLNAFGRWK